ncbi:MAG: hypothetical protein IKB88_08120 [Clostridia bacterium]|nr:hypothetical protein [Clostridia bacterium]
MLSVSPVITKSEKPFLTTSSAMADATTSLHTTYAPHFFEDFESSIASFKDAVGVM